MESALRTFSSQVSVNSATNFSFSCSWSTASSAMVEQDPGPPGLLGSTESWRPSSEDAPEREKSCSFPKHDQSRGIEIRMRIAKANSGCLVAGLPVRPLYKPVATCLCWRLTTPWGATLSSLQPSLPTKLQKLEPINATEIAFSSCFVRLLTKFGNADERLIHGGEKLGDLCQKGGEGVVCCQTRVSLPSTLKYKDVHSASSKTL